MGDIEGSAGEFEVELRIDPEPRPRELSVAFHSGDLLLAGSLFLPNGPGPHPAVVVVPAARDVSRAANRAYYGRSDLLARWGFAALLYDKRGSGASEGDWRTVSFEDLADDARAAVEYVRTRDEVLSDRVSLLGGSQAGWISPMVAAHTNVASVVLISAPAVDVATSELHAIEHDLRNDGFSDEAVKDAIAHMRLFCYVVRTGLGFDELLRSSQIVNAEPWGDFVHRPERSEDLAWWRLVDSHDPRRYLPTGLPPTLALYGTQDAVVPPIENAKRLQQLLEEGGTRAVVRVYPEGDHRVEVPARQLEDGTFRFPQLAPGMPRDMKKFLLENGGTPGDVGERKKGGHGTI